MWILVSSTSFIKNCNKKLCIIWIRKVFSLILKKSRPLRDKTYSVLTTNSWRKTIGKYFKTEIFAYRHFKITLQKTLEIYQLFFLMLNQNYLNNLIIKKFSLHNSDYCLPMIIHKPTLSNWFTYAMIYYLPKNVTSIFK